MQAADANAHGGCQDAAPEPLDLQAARGCTNRWICACADLITSAFDNSIMYPSADDMVRQCGKMALLDRMLPLLRKRGHKILIFSQVGAAASQPCCATCGGVPVAAAPRCPGGMLFASS